MQPKPLYWVGSSREDLRLFPRAVRRIMGYALYLAQVGAMHRDAKPLRGFGSAGVLEIAVHRAGAAYRAVYTTRLSGAVYVLHAFQKKARKGARTPKHEMELIRARLGIARLHQRLE